MWYGKTTFGGRIQKFGPLWLGGLSLTVCHGQITLFPAAKRLETISNPGDGTLEAGIPQLEVIVADEEFCRTEHHTDRAPIVK